MWSKIAYLRALLAISRRRLPRKRILITADLDQPLFDSRTRKFIEALSAHRVPLTVFSPNGDGKGAHYADLTDVVRFAGEKGVPVELASHSLNHDSLAGRRPSEIAAVIRKSVSLFHEAGIPVRGFRSPFLSTQKVYREVLENLDGDTLLYDSSILFEGNLSYSLLHDLIPRKCPHRIGEIWELPLSCLDDYLLFEKLKKDDPFVSSYWKKKLDINLRIHHYFLLLVHPAHLVPHLRAFEDFLDDAMERETRDCFTTCCELTRELRRSTP